VRFVLLIMVGVLAAASTWANPVTVERVEVEGGAAPTVRLLFSAEPVQPFAHTLPPRQGTPARIYIDFAASRLGADVRAAQCGSGPLVRVRTGQLDASTARIVLDLTDPVPFEMQTQGRVVTIVLGGDEGACSPACNSSRPHRSPMP